FHRFPRVDTPVFILKAVNKRGKSFNVDITIDQLPPPPFGAPIEAPGNPWYVNSDSILLNHVRSGSAYRRQLEYTPDGKHKLKGVVIKASKIVPDSQNLNGPGNADVILDEKDLEAAGKKSWLQLLGENVKNFREGTFFINGNTQRSLREMAMAWYVADGNGIPGEWYFIGGKPIKFIVDGASASQILRIGRFYDLMAYLKSHSAEDIKGIEVMSSTQYANKYTSMYDNDEVLYQAATKAGILLGPSDFAFVEITTRSGHGPAISNTPGVYLYKPLAISWPKQFYKPRYQLNDTTRLVDLRATIDWEPNVITDSLGRAKMSFYAAEKPSTYTVIVEGTDMQGNLGFSRRKIAVVAKKEEAKSK
ncbi:MAG: hypothetical protein JST32_10175, partial [Bacteroidetes bacterium]|nr:hypothetical protein [Bacteroidota bacterium]